MNTLTKHFIKETRRQNIIQQREINNLIHAKSSLWINVSIYVLITVIEYWLSMIGHSQALRADAFNNLSGVISTVILIIGLAEATNTDDDDFIGKPIAKEDRNNEALQLSRFRLETIFTLITSFVIVLIALQIIVQSGISLFHLKDKVSPNLLSALGAFIATILMLVVWFLNHHNGKKLHSTSLLAAARDSLGDVVTSLGTMITVLISHFLNLPWLDGTVSIAIGLFILWSGIKIFQECALNLADYVDPEFENEMKESVSEFKMVHKVLDLRSHYSGNILVVDIFIMVAPDKTALELYKLNKHIENKLRNNFNVYDTTITVIPDPKDIK
ncbi:cation diffusion facilitator family transporter [Companilactobacillus mishanensis]|uniref:cation diffusion facilitator family transporter n=1 Tax=Companilactobacillus mishanensis TaxID=2486008 RepID=UPI001295A5B5|nr:cation diffusion facilitator family transporter [Companilactobacillus mishanensis]MQS89588.1 cation transporter [Companilactobacillus mishanensis]